MNLPKTFKNKKYPAFIRDHKAIKNSKPIVKDFERVGIADYSDPYTHSATQTLEKFTLELKKCILSYIKIWDKYSDCFCASKTYLVRPELSKLRDKITYRNIKTKNKLVLPCGVRIPSHYRGKAVSYEKGSSLLLLLNSMCLDVDDAIGLDKITAPFRRLLDHGVDLELSWIKNLKVVFSSHPWDIATMSMRGISSCQAWGKQQSSCLIGSILDPNMALIYLTDGELYKNYGPRMLARAVIRLTAPSMKYSHFGYGPVTKEESEKRIVYLENAYASFASYATQSSVFGKIFGKSLNDGGYCDKNKTLLTTTQAKRYFCGIPFTPAVKKLAPQYLSYRDSGLMYVSLPT